MASLFDLLRLCRVGWVLAREGAFTLISPLEAPAPLKIATRFARLVARQDVHGGKGLARAFVRLGPSWVKLGQFLATRPDVVGMPVARDLETLQDRMAPFPDRKSTRLNSSHQI